MKISSFIMLFLTIIEINSQCWKSSYSRGSGSPLKTCPFDQEKSGALCYKKCKNGYYGVGPVCWLICPFGYEDYGIFCYRPQFTYHKSCFNNFDINTCKSCLNGYHDHSFFCKRDSHLFVKDSYQRDVGKPLICDGDQEQNGALCYPKCIHGFVGYGPVCWLDCTNTSTTYECGVLCTGTSRQCAQFTTAIMSSGVYLAGTILGTPIQITGSLYTSLIVGAVSGSAGALSISSYAILDMCTINNSTQTTK